MDQNLQSNSGQHILLYAVIMLLIIIIGILLFNKEGGRLREFFNNNSKNIATDEGDKPTSSENNNTDQEANSSESAFNEQETDSNQQEDSQDDDAQTDDSVDNTVQEEQLPDLAVKEAHFENEKLLFQIWNQGNVKFEGRLQFAVSFVDSNGYTIVEVKGSNPLTIAADSFVETDSDELLLQEMFNNKPIYATDVKIVLDPANQLQESNEANNTEILASYSDFNSLSLAPPLQIKLPNFVFRLETGFRAADDFFLVVANDGAKSVRPPLVWFEWLDNENVVLEKLEIGLWWTQLPGFVLKSGESYAYEMRAHRDDAVFLDNRPQEAVKLRVTLDPQMEVSELNESDNARSFMVFAQ